MVEVGQLQGFFWMFEVLEDFIGVIVYWVIVEAGIYVDGEESVLLVLINWIFVMEMMFLLISGVISKIFDFNVLKKVQQFKILQQYQFILEFIFNLVWYVVKVFFYFMEYFYECIEQIFSCYYVNSLALFVVNQYLEVQCVFEQWCLIDVLLSELE